MKGVLKDRVADFFRRGRRFLIEASWPIDTKGKPRTGTGRYRYPIGYPANSREARTGHSTHFNAPFASDNERHAPAWNEATNTELREECESLLIDAVAHHAIPRWKADGLNPIVPSADTDNGSEVVRALLAALVTRGALPVLNWRQAAELATKGKGESVKAAARHQAAQGSPKDERRYRFVVPALTWAEGTVEPLLSLLCPPSEAQLDPRAHADIVSLLADGKTPGFAEEFVTFDENDVIDRVTSQGNQCFGAIADREREFSQSFIVRVYLDLIELALDQVELEAAKEDALLSTLLLPDVNGQATAFSDLYSNASLPSNIPDLHLPPILDGWPGCAMLSSSAESGGFGSSRWRSSWRALLFKPPTSKLGGCSGNGCRGTAGTFRRVTDRNSPNSSSGQTRITVFAGYPISASRARGALGPCLPVSFGGRTRRFAAPSWCPSGAGRERRFAARQPRTRSGLGLTHSWRDLRSGANRTLQRPTSCAVSRDMYPICLRTDPVAPLLKAAASALPALARDGAIRLRTELVFPSRGNDRLALPDRFLLRDRQRAAMLAKLSPALNAPTAAMLLDAFAEDSGNFSALQPRLKEFISITESDDDERRELAGKRIIPVNGQSRAPWELAFTGNRGDYWGDWKIQHFD